MSYGSQNTVRRKEQKLVVTLSSKGQLVIPKTIRRALALQPGAKFSVELNQEQQIVLHPLPEPSDIHAIIESLHGALAGEPLLEMLEEEHRWEIARDEERFARFMDRNAINKCR